MAKVNLSIAAKLVGKNRTTIWRNIKSGKLSSERGVDGLPTVDTSELMRVYGEIKRDATPKEQPLQQLATPQYEELLATINSLRAEQAEMKEQITSLTNRLTHTPLPFTEKGLPVKQSPKGEPEKDPRWPQEIKSVADIALRNEIRNEYQASDA